MKRLAKMLLGALLAVLALLIPAEPANAANDYLLDMSIDADLEVHASMNIPLSEELATLLGGALDCGLIKAWDEFFPGGVRDLSNFKVESCDQQGNILSFELSGQAREGAQSTNGWKITKDEIILSFSPGIGAASDANETDIGGIRVTFPGTVKSVEPNVGSTSGNIWSVDNPSEIDRTVTITAERNKPSFFSGLRPVHLIIITTLLLITIAAVIVAVLVIRNRKKKPQNSSRSKPDSSIYPPSASMSKDLGIPGEQPHVVGSPQMPGYPTAPGAPGMPGAAPYPPNVPPQGQPAVPMPGGNYPYPYPYPPANPQGSQAGYPMPPQSYGSPAPGFPPPQTPLQPDQPTNSPMTAQSPRQDNRKKPGFDEQENPDT